MKTADVAIAGGGIAGIYSAWRLARDGATVTLFEAGEQLGGVSFNSRLWHGHWLDNGIHNLDLRSPKDREFYSDILNSDLRIIKNHCWASTTGRRWSHGLECPDLFTDSPDVANEALAQLQTILELQRQTNSESPACEFAFHKWYADNYGAALANAVLPMISKVTGSDASTMGSNVGNSLNRFSRIKLGTDDSMIRLKQSDEFWNQRLAVSLHCGDERFINSNNDNGFGYPARHGLSGFSEKALTRLQELGVRVCLKDAVTGIQQEASQLRVTTDNQELSVKKLLWTLPDHLLSRLVGINDEIQQYQVPVGYSFYAFEVPGESVAQPDYLLDFSADTMVYTYSHPSRIGDTFTSDGYGYVLAEIPSHPKNIASLQNDETLHRVWQDVLNSGYVREDSHYRNATFWPLMVAYSVPRVGFAQAYETYQTELEGRYSGLYTIKPALRGRAAFISAYDSTLHQKLL